MNFIYQAICALARLVTPNFTMLAGFFSVCRMESQAMRNQNLEVEFDAVEIRGMFVECELVRNQQCIIK